jgi:hypothetical protein
VREHAGPDLNINPGLMDGLIHFMERSLTRNSSHDLLSETVSSCLRTRAEITHQDESPDSKQQPDQCLLLLEALDATIRQVLILYWVVVFDIFGRCDLVLCYVPAFSAHVP